MSHPSYLTPFDDSALSSHKLKALQTLEDEFDLSNSEIDKVVKQFLWEFNQGLSKVAHTPEEADTYLPMIPTFIHAVPDGTEKGTFLALDLGGTNLRVASVDLDGKKDFTLKQQKYKVSDALKTGEASDLFDYIAESVEHFITTHLFEFSKNEHPKDKLFLGFTFSFPVKQTALDSGTLITWTKGFTASNAKGKDVVVLLQTALDKRQIPVICSALVNDTVGTMLSRAYQSGGAVLGAIFGTGTNAAYLERYENVKTMTPDAKEVPQEYMIINTEWGAFDNERKVLRVTRFDNKLDRESINPRKQAFEKMISGMYLGEILRNILLHLIDSNLLFSGRHSTVLNTHYGLDTAVMSDLEAGPASPPANNLSQDGQKPSASSDTARLREIIRTQLEIEEKYISDEDCLLVLRASELVGTRGARLSGAAIAAVFKQTKSETSGEDFLVGVDGSLVEFYPRFEERVRVALKASLGKDEPRVKIGLAKDGSGVGAALTALVAKKQQESQLPKVHE